MVDVKISFFFLYRMRRFLFLFLYCVLTFMLSCFIFLMKNFVVYLDLFNFQFDSTTYKLHIKLHYKKCTTFSLYMFVNTYFFHALLLLVLLYRFILMEILRFMYQLLWLLMVLNIPVWYTFVLYWIFTAFCWCGFLFFNLLFLCFLFSVLTWCLKHINLLIIINSRWYLHTLYSYCLIVWPHFW